LDEPAFVCATFWLRGIFVTRWGLEKASAKNENFDIVQGLLYSGVVPVVRKFSASRIVMYARDHLLAHVHVQLRDGRECLVELESLNIVGRIAAREIREQLSCHE
jgi:hypothetical protein